MLTSVPAGASHPVMTNKDVWNIDQTTLTMPATQPIWTRREPIFPEDRLAYVARIEREKIFLIFDQETYEQCPFDKRLFWSLGDHCMGMAITGKIDVETRLHGRLNRAGQILPRAFSVQIYRDSMQAISLEFAVAGDDADHVFTTSTLDTILHLTGQTVYTCRTIGKKGEIAGICGPGNYIYRGVDEAYRQVDSFGIKVVSESFSSSSPVQMVLTDGTTTHVPFKAIFRRNEVAATIRHTDKKLNPHLRAVNSIMAACHPAGPFLQIYNDSLDDTYGLPQRSDDA